MSRQNKEEYAKYLGLQLKENTIALKRQKAETVISRTEEFVRLVDEIAALGTSKGVSMGEWAKEMKTIPYDEHHNFSYFVKEAPFYDVLLNLVEKMRLKLREGRQQILDRGLEIREEYTADGIQDQVERANQHYFQAEKPSRSHSLAHETARVSGRYASMVGLETGRRSKDGGYHFRRFC